jgi:hypothetical protein
MINEHIISIEFGSNSFNATCNFNTKAHSLERKMFMNWNVWYGWYNGKKNTRSTVSWTLKKTLLNFWILVFVTILFAMHFFNDRI